MAGKKPTRFLMQRLLPGVAMGSALGLTAFCYRGGLPALSFAGVDTSKDTSPSAGKQDTIQGGVSFSDRSIGVSSTIDASASQAAEGPGDGPLIDSDVKPRPTLSDRSDETMSIATTPEREPLPLESDYIDPPRMPVDPRIGGPETDPHTAISVPRTDTDVPDTQRSASSGGAGVSVATAGSGGGGGSGSLGTGSAGGGGGGGGGGGPEDGSANDATGAGAVGGGLSDGSIGTDPLPDETLADRDNLDQGIDSDSPDYGLDSAVLPDNPVDPDTYIKPLLLFDEMKAQGGPALVADHGFQPLVVMYAVHLWEDGEDREEPNLELIRERAALIADGSIVCVDIEEWELRVPIVSLEESEAAIDRLILCLRAVRETNPTLRIGLYRLVPERNWKVPLYHYWKDRADRPSEFRNDEYWQRREDRWDANNERVERLAEHVDVVFPSLYSFTDDPDQWELYARMNIEAARRYGKPVYPFIWPRYHAGALNGVGGTSVSYDMWSRQLQVLHYIADGTVVWSSGNDVFRSDDPWWQATQDYQQAVEDNPLVLWGD